MLFLIGLGDALATVVDLPGSDLLQHAPLVAFLVWTAWMVVTGVMLIRTARALPIEGLRDK